MGKIATGPATIIATLQTQVRVQGDYPPGSNYSTMRIFPLDILPSFSIPWLAGSPTLSGIGGLIKCGRRAIGK